MITPARLLLLQVVRRLRRVRRVDAGGHAGRRRRPTSRTRHGRSLARSSSPARRPSTAASRRRATRSIRRPATGARSRWSRATPQLDVDRRVVRRGLRRGGREPRRRSRSPSAPTGTRPRSSSTTLTFERTEFDGGDARASGREHHPVSRAVGILRTRGTGSGQQALEIPSSRPEIIRRIVIALDVIALAVAAAARQPQPVGASAQTTAQRLVRPDARALRRTSTPPSPSTGRRRPDRPSRSSSRTAARARRRAR